MFLLLFYNDNIMNFPELWL